jgi:hypothetical protein
MSAIITIKKHVLKVTVNGRSINMISGNAGYLTYEVATQVEAEAGIEAALRAFSPLRVAQAIAALESANATPGGSDTQIQFNDGGVFGGAPAVTYTKGTKKLCLGTAGNNLLEEHRGKIYQLITDHGSQNGTYDLNCDSSNDHIITANGNLVLGLSNVTPGQGGVIILKITGAGGYTISLDPTSFTTKLNGSDDIDTVTNKKNLISYWNDGTYTYYSITNEA